MTIIPEIKRGNENFRNNCVLKSFGEYFKLRFFSVPAGKMYTIELHSLFGNTLEIVGEFYYDGRYSVNNRLFHAELILN